MSTPYDLRLRMLEMSKDYLDKQYQLNKEISDKTFELARQFYIKHGGEIPMFNPPSMYRAEDIVKLAEQYFNMFVSGTNQK